MVDHETPQTFETVREILQHVLEAHADAIRRYAAAAHGTDDHRRAALLDFLRDCEQEIVTAIARYVTSGDTTLDSYVQNIPARLFESSADEPPPSDFDAAAAAFDQRHRVLTRIYEQLQASIANPRVRTIFADLALMGKRNRQRLRQALIDA